MRSKLENPKDKNSTGSKIQSDNIEIICENLDNRPVTITELEVIETYAGDIIKSFIADLKSSNRKE